jgi:trehalose-phosphatase
MTEGPGEAVRVEGAADFWERVRTSKHRCLVLDYDGTLAPFRKNRMDAVPLDGIVELLVRIRDSDGTDLALMTGRPLDELLILLGDLGVPISASQGVEFHSPDGRRTRHHISPRQEERLQRAQEEAAALGLGHAIERKAASVALHTRPMEADEAERAERELSAVWSRDAGEYGLECLHFKGGIEIRLAGVDKGTALDTLLESSPAGTFCVYVGDDTTDEDAFRAVRDRGIGIRVGDPREETQATGHLADPEAVREFLREWIRVTES